MCEESFVARESTMNDESDRLTSHCDSESESQSFRSEQEIIALPSGIMEWENFPGRTG